MEWEPGSWQVWSSLQEARSAGLGGRWDKGGRDGGPMMHPDVPPDEGREECVWCLEPWAQKGEGGAESPDVDLLDNPARHLYNGLLRVILLLSEQRCTKRLGNP